MIGLPAGVVYSDATMLVQTLVRVRISLVAVNELVIHLGWDDDRLADALVDAETAGRVQTWADAGDDVLRVVLSPEEAQRHGLRLAETSGRWIPISARERVARRVRSTRVVTENAMDPEIHGAGYLKELADPRSPEPVLALIRAEVESGQAPNDEGKHRKVERPRPWTTFLGMLPWPPPGAITKAVPVGNIGDIIVLAMEAEVCSVCGGTAEDYQSNCLVCCGSWPEELKRLRDRRRKPRVVTDKEVPEKPECPIRFKPISRGAKRKAVSL